MELDKHQAALDGIRGFAAISVVLYHVGHWLGAPLASNSGLAVDLFFMLSGYVLTLAYRDKLSASMTVQRFLVVRLMRFMPLVVLGTLISAVYAVVRSYVKHEDVALAAIATAALLGLVDLPYLAAPFGGNMVFPLNGPQYTLFLEIVANTLWASIGWLGQAKQAAVIAAACLAIVVMMGVLGGDTPETFLSGFPRVGASFFGGVALFHLDYSLPFWRGWPSIKVAF